MNAHILFAQIRVHSRLKDLLYIHRMLNLPENLERAIGEILQTMPTTQWTSAAQKLSRRYRGPRQELPKSWGGTL